MTENNQPKGLSTSRIETLVDGVFAIAMTLLILNIKVPVGITPQNLFHSLLEYWPQFAAYVVSFLVISVYWVGHHYQFFWIKKSDRNLLWLNVFFLMSISFVPFSASLLATYSSAITAVLVYGCNVILAGLLLYWHWAYASGKGNLLEPNVHTHLIKATGDRILLGLGFYIIATLVAFYSTKISLILFALLPFLYMRPSKVIDTHTK